MSRPTVSAVVLARDESAMIAGCLQRLEWADERLVLVDSATRDDTAERAAALGARVEFNRLVSFAQQRNVGLGLARGDWVLFVDADERVTPELTAEVQRAVADPDAPDGYWLSRCNIICGRWVRHAGWYPDRQLRLLRRHCARYDERSPVHEVADLDGPTGSLQVPLIHFNYQNLGEFVSRQRRYARLEAQGLAANGIRPRPRSLVVQPAREFWRRYIELKGYREGPLGLTLSLLLAYATLETYARLLRLNRRPSGRGRGRPS